MAAVDPSVTVTKPAPAQSSTLCSEYKFKRVNTIAVNYALYASRANSTEQMFAHERILLNTLQFHLKEIPFPLLALMCDYTIPHTIYVASSDDGFGFGLWEINIHSKTTTNMFSNEPCSRIIQRHITSIVVNQNDQSLLLTTSQNIWHFQPSLPTSITNPKKVAGTGPSYYFNDLGLDQKSLALEKLVPVALPLFQVPLVHPHLFALENNDCLVGDTFGLVRRIDIVKQTISSGVKFTHNVDGIAIEGSSPPTGIFILGNLGMSYFNFKTQVKTNFVPQVIPLATALPTTKLNLPSIQPKWDNSFDGITCALPNFPEYYIIWDRFNFYVFYSKSRSISCLCPYSAPTGFTFYYWTLLPLPCLPIRDDDPAIILIGSDRANTTCCIQFTIPLKMLTLLFSDIKATR